MRIVPERTNKRITWYKTHQARWAAHAAELGLDAGQITALEEKVALAAEKYKAQRRAYDAARSATANLNAAMEQLSELGSTMLLQIKSKAAREGEEIYGLAWVRRPAAPAPIAAPGTPHSFSQYLFQSGELGIRWKCQNPRGSQGTMYEVARSVTRPNGPFEVLGFVGRKQFVDPSIPAGTKEVTYRITAFRSTRRGQPGFYTCSLGMSGYAPGMLAWTYPDSVGA